MKKSDFKPFRVTIAASAGILLTMIGIVSHHPLMVVIHGGRWCARLTSDGQHRVVYGSACGMRTPDANGERGIPFELSKRKSSLVQ